MGTQRGTAGLGGKQTVECALVPPRNGPVYRKKHSNGYLYSLIDRLFSRLRRIVSTSAGISYQFCTISRFFIEIVNISPNKYT